ncbi:hypothetical protein H1C71_022334 [Ictidomys tridecemlineatus]|nr:hypothetical protein H1C71_022334 [Ictidomys tridecemlineatus]
MGLSYIRELMSFSSLAGIVLVFKLTSARLSERLNSFPWTHSMLFPELHCHQVLHVSEWHLQKACLMSRGPLCGTHCTDLDINGTSLALRGRAIWRHRNTQIYSAYKPLPELDNMDHVMTQKEQES